MFFYYTGLGGRGGGVIRWGNGSKEIRLELNSTGKNTVGNKLSDNTEDLTVTERKHNAVDNWSQRDSGIAWWKGCLNNIIYGVLYSVK